MPLVTPLPEFRFLNVHSPVCPAFARRKSFAVAPTQISGPPPLRSVVQIGFLVGTGSKGDDGPALFWAYGRMIEQPVVDAFSQVSFSVDAYVDDALARALGLIIGGGKTQTIDAALSPRRGVLLYFRIGTEQNHALATAEHWRKHCRGLFQNLTAA
jgi:hypothetical protein